MALLITFLVIVAIILIYALWLRDWLKQQPWAQGYFDLVEPVERLAFKKSETILWARTLQIIGLLMTFLAGLGEFDLSPLLAFLPEKWKWVASMLPLIISVAGSINVKLREQTTLPLEVVALPDKVSSDVAVSVQAAVVASKDAIATVKDDKASPALPMDMVAKPDISTQPPKAGG